MTWRYLVPLCALLPFSLFCTEPKSYEPGFSWTAQYKKNYLVDNPFFPFFVELDQDLEKIPIGDYYLSSRLKLLEWMVPFARMVGEDLEQRLEKFIDSISHYQKAPTKEQIPLLRKELDELCLSSFETLDHREHRDQSIDYEAALGEALEAFRVHLEQTKESQTVIELKNLSDHEELICLLADNMKFSPKIEDGIEFLDEKFITFIDEPSSRSYEELMSSVKKLQTQLSHRSSKIKLSFKLL